METYTEAFTFIISHTPGQVILLYALAGAILACYRTSRISWLTFPEPGLCGRPAARAPTRIELLVGSIGMGLLVTAFVLVLFLLMGWVVSLLGADVRFCAATALLLTAVNTSHRAVQTFQVSIRTLEGISAEAAAASAAAEASKTSRVF